MAYLSTVFRAQMSRFTQRPFSGLVYSEEVRQAKSDKKAIVALESTIITHGMPYPNNLETALQVEDIIRQQGAKPATIAILKGQLTIGLTKEQLQYLAQAKDVVKASRRDLAPIMAQKLDGATTVAGTIIAANLADIPVFVTGGIGGVHRDGQNTMDVSADLTELGRSSTLVVCSGVKSILDIGRTLEYLETEGVTVCSFGKSQEFPAFYTARSGWRAPHRAVDASHAARLLLAAHQLRLSSGIVIAVPVPEEYAMDENNIETAIKSALLDAEKLGVQGPKVTPYLLEAVSLASAGDSLRTNIALIKNNAKVGADIAVQFEKLRNLDNLENDSNIGISRRGNCKTDSSRRYHTRCEDVLVVGGANVDRTYRLTGDTAQVQLDGSTHACKTEQCGGGVGRNMAEALWRMREGRVRLLTAVGNDDDGLYLQNIAPGLILDGCIMKHVRTATYAAVFDGRGECVLGLGDMDIHEHITIDLVNKHMDELRNAALVVLDGNVPSSTLDYILGLCNQYNKPVFFEPTDKRKAIKPLNGSRKITFASPNLLELRAMARFLNPNYNISRESEVDEILSLAAIVLNVVCDQLIITRGSKGVMTIKRSSFIKGTPQILPKQLEVRMYAGDILHSIENVSGAGDCFASGFIHGVLLGLDETSQVSFGFQAAKEALMSKATVPPKFNVSTNYDIKCIESWTYSKEK